MKRSDFTIRSLAFCFLVLFAEGSDLVRLPERDEAFFIQAKSSDIVVKTGGSFLLNCQINKPWHTCSWKPPNKEWCSFLATTKYDTGCNSNDRINHALGHLEFESPVNKNCFITVTHAQPMDSGTWNCHAAQEVTSASEQIVESVSVTVVHPVELMPISSETFIFANESDKAEIVCNATVIGEEEPKITWLVNHREVNPHRVTREPKEGPGEDGRWFLLVGLQLKNIPNDSHLVCRSKQTFPNGTVWLEKVVMTQLHIVAKPSPLKALETEDEGSHTNVAGTTIAALVVIATFISIFLICYAKQKKTWCYRPDEKPILNDQPSPSAPQYEEGSLLIQNINSNPPPPLVEPVQDVLLGRTETQPSSQINELHQESTNGVMSGSSSDTGLGSSLDNNLENTARKIPKDPLNFVAISNPNIFNQMEATEMGDIDGVVRISTDSLNTRYAELISAAPASTFIRSHSLSQDREPATEPIYAQIGGEKRPLTQPASFPNLEKKRVARHNNYVKVTLPN
ncbi:hypothetical protein TCAL_00201 [Tigriopus californicus]|uniref:Ig-like domain-containing protein n=1 Tax=Tigriopus californicus TaxID=6832 RepID=A0A553P389_TIGCA|nr:uncharacterized protein LOC131883863 [Tigriopus californicus]TRY72151.1 hypothetical protein TCAL_00201 [Tigriopus californicus]